MAALPLGFSDAICLVPTESLHIPHNIHCAVCEPLYNGLQNTVKELVEEDHKHKCHHKMKENIIVGLYRMCSIYIYRAVHLPSTSSSDPSGPSSQQPWNLNTAMPTGSLALSTVTSSKDR